MSKTTTSSFWQAQHGCTKKNSSRRFPNSTRPPNIRTKSSNERKRRWPKPRRCWCYQKKARRIWGGHGKLINPQDRPEAVELIQEAVAGGARVVKACEVLGIAPSTYTKWAKDEDSKDDRLMRKPGAKPRRIPDEERERICDRLNEPDVVDMSVRHAYYELLDRGSTTGPNPRCTASCARTKPTSVATERARPYHATSRAVTKPPPQSSVGLGHHVHARRAARHAFLLRVCRRGRIQPLSGALQCL